jgi:hypothetical protein
MDRVFDLQSALIWTVAPPFFAAERWRIAIAYHAIECKAYKEGWWWRPEWWKQVKAACGNDIPVLIYKFNNKQSRVCIPMYAINPALPRDNDLTTVMTFDDWLVIMRKNWDHYERLTES